MLLLAVLTFAHFVLGDTSLVGEWLVIWPPAGWLLLLAPRLGLLLYRGLRREAGLLAVAATSFVLATTAPELLPVARRTPTLTPAHGSQGRALRVVTWNVSAQTPLDVLAPLDPDLVLFTECGHLQPAAEHPAFRSYQRVFGLDPCALSRYPVHVLPTRKVGQWQEPLVLRVEPPGAPGFVAVGVRLTLPAVVVALAAFEGWDQLLSGHHERLEQYRRLASLIEETRDAEGRRPVVLAGDFNVPGGMRSLDPLRKSLRDIWPEAGIGWGATMTERFPVSRIDQIWVSPEISAVAARVHRGVPSDHRLVVANLRLP